MDITAPRLEEASPAQKVYFDTLIEQKDSLGMYCLQETLNPMEFTSLYHSFERGTKGRYQDLVNRMVTRGREEFFEYVTLIRTDYIVTQEVAEEVGPIALKQIMKKCEEAE